MPANYQTLTNDLPNYTPMEKLDILLQHLMMASRQFGNDAEFSPEWDYPLVFCTDKSELTSLLDELGKRGYAESDRDSITLTLNGWERAFEVGKKGRSSDAAFIAMSFHPSHDATYERCIAPAIEDAGYRPLRVDKVEHVNRIDDQIIADIRRSRFMVADLTDQRQGVYFEAGMMMGLGRTVIWMVRKDDLSKVHFDNRQYNFIVYEDLEEAKQRLLLRILALEGEGPIKVQ
jgi:nucleoside 2-deoxyribosyltransferase